MAKEEKKSLKENIADKLIVTSIIGALIYFGSMMFNSLTSDSIIRNIVDLAISIIAGILNMFYDKIPADTESFLNLIQLPAGTIAVISLSIAKWSLIVKIFKSIFGLIKKIYGFATGRISSDSKPKIAIFKNDSSFGAGLPPLSLLGDVESFFKAKSNAEEITRQINEAFVDFNISARVEKYKTGPTISRYFLKLASSVKLKDINSIRDDLSIRVKTKNIRISTSDGIVLEIPNLEKRTLLHREVMEEVLNSKLPQLAMLCGKNILGDPYCVDLANAPHLLVGGSTGQGKSVCVNSLIISLLMRNSPKDLKFIMIDPKVIEFAFFVNLPHLLFPVANDIEKSKEILQWCVKEMKRRYEELKKLKLKSLYDLPINKRPFPVIVIVVDELAQLTALNKTPDDFIEALGSLATMARACGMHMILATQRPDKEAVPGQISSNITSAIALKVRKDYESRIIIGQEGAEKLIGKGDMLVSVPGEDDLVRCQGSFLKNEHIEAVVEWWEKNYSSEGKEIVEVDTASAAAENVDDECDQVEQEQQDNEIQESSPELALRRSICKDVLDTPEDTQINLPTLKEMIEILNLSEWNVRKIIEKLTAEKWITTIGEKKGTKTIVILNKNIAELWIEKNKAA